LRKPSDQFRARRYFRRPASLKHRPPKELFESLDGVLQFLDLLRVFGLHPVESGVEFPDLPLLLLPELFLLLNNDRSDLPQHSLRHRWFCEGRVGLGQSGTQHFLLNMAAFLGALLRQQVCEGDLLGVFASGGEVGRQDRCLQVQGNAE